MVWIAECLTSGSWISAPAFSEIVGATIKVMNGRASNASDLSLEDFDDSVLSRAALYLNETVAISYQNHFRQALGMDTDQFISDAAAALRYFEKIDHFISLGFEYETANDRLRDQLQGVLRAREECAAERYKGRHLWEATFYPEVLGLFSALFDEEPKTTWNEDTDASLNPTITFLTETIFSIRASHVAEALEKASENAAIDMPDWELHGHAAIRNKIAKWKKVRRPDASDKEYWRECAEAYRAQLFFGK